MRPAAGSRVVSPKGKPWHLFCWKAGLWGIYGNASGLHLGDVSRGIGPRGGRTTWVVHGASTYSYKTLTRAADALFAQQRVARGREPAPLVASERSRA